MQAQTWTSNVSAKIVDRTLDDQGPVERKDRDSYSWLTSQIVHCTQVLRASQVDFRQQQSAAPILDWAAHLRARSHAGVQRCLFVP